jgi:speckle-type POZ protein
MLVGMGVGKFVSSSTFSVSGSLWNIRLYPDGFMKDYAGNMSVLLHYLSSANEVRTKFSLNILKKKGHGKLTNYPLLDYVFSAESGGYGYSSLFDNSKLNSSSHLDHGRLTIRCVLTIIKTNPSEPTTNLVVAAQPNVQDHLKLMLTDGDGADVTFSVRGQLFNAHRCLLAARSPVFKAQLFGPMKETSTHRIMIDDMEPQIFGALLHFIYTDCMTDDYKEGQTRNLQHLLVAADRYGVDRLRLMCEGRLCDSIDVKTVATTLVLAEQHNCQVLRKACVDFVASRNALDAVMKTEGFKHLKASCPQLITAILARSSYTWCQVSKWSTNQTTTCLHELNFTHL